MADIVPLLHPCHKFPTAISCTCVYTSDCDHCSWVFATIISLTMWVTVAKYDTECGQSNRCFPATITISNSIQTTQLALSTVEILFEAISVVYYRNTVLVWPSSFQIKMSKTTHVMGKTSSLPSFY